MIYALGCLYSFRYAVEELPRTERVFKYILSIDPPFEGSMQTF